MTIDPRTPILIGVGQITRRGPFAAPADLPSPQDLRRDAARAALADSGAGAQLLPIIDEIVVIRTMLDSIPGAPQPLGRCANPPATLAADIGIAPARLAYSVAGGDQPQALVSAAAAAIWHGQARAVLIAGSEATAAWKQAARMGAALDWSRSAGGDHDDRGLGPMLLSPYEMANGLGAPTQTYPVIEHALRARLGQDRDSWRREMSGLWAGFSSVAADNPHAMFPVARTAEWLATESAENYLLADPYLKWHVAQDAVNQGAAVILTSVGEAQRMGSDPARWVYLHGHAEASDACVSERPDLSRSRAITAAIGHAMAAARATADEIDLIDLYSCFPCVVVLAAEALGIDWRTRTLTVTGGLPFFGGPGNSYSLHAIATMTERLRARPDATGLILANGGFISKEAVGIYAARPAIGWHPTSSASIQDRIDRAPGPRLVTQATDATVESYTVTYAKGTAQRGYVVGAVSDDARIVARIRKGDGAVLAALANADPVGRRVTIAPEDGINIIKALH